DDVLDATRIEAGHLYCCADSFDLRATVEEMVDFLAPSAFQKGIELIFNFNNDIPRWVIGDAERIRQITTNLIGNAIKFTEKGHIYVDIQSEKRTGNDITLLFRVEDTGPGIAEKDVNSIFERFTQVDGSDTRKHGGMGMGLSLCRDLVKLMDGEIGVESRLG